MDHISLARNEKILGQLELRYQLMAEKDRLASVLEKFEEKHGSLYSELCLLCLEDINVNSSANLVTTFACCGGFICNNCADDFIVKDANKQQCPLCRASYMDIDEFANTLRLAKNGQPGAQTDAGAQMMFGYGEYEKRQRTGLELLEKAAAQNYPMAILRLAMLHRPDSPDSIVKKSSKKYSEMLTKAANLGSAAANAFLAKAYIMAIPNSLHFSYVLSKHFWQNIPLI